MRAFNCRRVEELENKTMSAGAIIIVAIAATVVLMMRFRKRWLAKINIAFTNRITSLFAGWFPGFGILTHVGRKSGKIHRTPVKITPEKSPCRPLAPTIMRASASDTRRKRA